MTPVVSVVIPCFNLGAYLNETVQSVLDQTYEDFEIIIVDDGSDDPATRHLMASYRRPRTHIVRTENRGLAHARNLGLEQANGRFVSFLDADDLYEPRFLERTVALLEKNPSIGLASCWLTGFGHANFLWTPETCSFPRLLAEDTVCTAALVRRDLVRATGGFDPHMPVAGYEAWDLAISIVEQGQEGSIIPEFLFRYRIRPGSMTASSGAPANHARLMEYLLDKHPDTYQKEYEGVLSVIGGRLEALEAQLADPPRRPPLDNRPNRWRRSILDLENHRRAVEERVRGVSIPPCDEAQSWGTLRRLEPVSRVWGLDRGRPVDRYYIERFLSAHRSAITGTVLEVKDGTYTRRFGAGIQHIDVIDIAEHNAEATIIADLSRPGSLPANRYDCFILTQTIHIIYEFEEAVRNAFRTLRPGGVLLATLPCVSRVDYESGIEGDFWRFTPASARRLFESIFGDGSVSVEVYGNVLACTAFLQGFATEELTSQELDHRDPYFPLILAIRAVKYDQARLDGEYAPPVEGYHDRATCQTIAGWAWKPLDPSRPVDVDVWDGDRLLGRARAKHFRQDLAEAGKGDGSIAFFFTPPEDVHASISHPIQVTAVGTGEVLSHSPRPLECCCTHGDGGITAHRAPLEEPPTRAESVVDESSSRRRGSPADGEGRAVVLLYHRLGRAARDVQRLSTEPAVFRAHMQILADRYEPISIADLVAARECGALPHRAVAVTFDDGYVSNLCIASPILRELSIPATFFVITQALEEEAEPWWDVVEHVLAERDVPDRLTIDVADEPFDFPLQTPAQRHRAVVAICNVLMRLSVCAREHVLAMLVEWGGSTLAVRGSRRLMISTEVVCLSNHPGHDIGSHTVHHLMLPAQPAPVQLRELLESRTHLELVTGRTVRALAYPYGAHNEATQRIAREAGFACALTVEEGAVTTTTNPFRMPRLEVRDDEPADFVGRLATFLGD